MGHFTLPIYGFTDSLYAIYRIIYLFHMPLFVFISGFLAKGIYRDGKLNIDRILSLFTLSLIYKVLIRLFENGLSVDYFLSEIFYFSSVPWYLFSLASWYSLVPVFKRLKPVPSIALSVILALLVGFYRPIGMMFSISRTFVFLPFFLLGYYCDRERFLSIQKYRKINIAICILCLILTIWFISTNFNAIRPFFYLVYGDCSYDKEDMLNGLVGRFCLYLLAIPYSLSLVTITPQKRVPLLSYMGQHTLQIFVIHRFLRTILAHFGFYSLSILNNNIPSMVIMLLITAVVVAISLLPIFGKAVGAMMQLRWNFLTSE